jgi:hypothetical protein
LFPDPLMAFELLYGLTIKTMRKMNEVEEAVVGD